MSFIFHVNYHVISRFINFGNNPCVFLVVHLNDNFNLVVFCEFSIFIIAGQEKFRAMTPMYYRNANAALLVFDITNYNSFIEVKGWVQELHK